MKLIPPKMRIPFLVACLVIGIIIGFVKTNFIIARVPTYRSGFFHVSYKGGRSAYISGSRLTIEGNSYVIVDTSMGNAEIVATLPLSSVESVVDASHEYP